MMKLSSKLLIIAVFIVMISDPVLAESVIYIETDQMSNEIPDVYRGVCLISVDYEYDGILDFCMYTGVNGVMKYWGEYPNPSEIKS